MTELLRSNLAHAAGGFVLMGCWATFANADHPFPVALRAGLVQGTLTAIITLFLKRVIEEIHRVSVPPFRTILPPAAAFAISTCLLAAIHTVADTPSVLRTIAVPITVSTFYAFLYTRQLSRNAP